MSPATASAVPDPYADKPSFWRRHADYVGAVVVGLLTIVLTVAMFPPSRAPELAYTFAVPALFWAYLRPSLKLYATTMLLAQAVAWTILLSWLHHVTWFGLFLLGPFVGAWVGSWYLAAWWALRRMRGRPTGLRIATILGLAALWVFIEWTRTWLLSGFPWLPLAATQWQRSSLLQVAAYTGASGISFILITFNLGFAAYAHRLLRERESGLRRRSPEFMAALVVLIFPTFLLMREVFGQQRRDLARVAFVQPYIPQSVKWDQESAPAIREIIERTTLAAGATRPDLVLWPEAVTPLSVKNDPSIRAWVESLVAKIGAPLLMGSVAIDTDAAGVERWSNSAFVVDPQVGLQTSSYAKRQLVPFGEFVPLRAVLGWLEKVVPIGGDFHRGADASPLIVRVREEPIVFGPLICYEDVYPRLARSSVLAGSEILVVLTNNAWFGEGGAAYQHAAHAALRAVETRRPVLRCGNGGWSGWFDEFGNTRGTLTNEAGSIYFRGTRTLTISRDLRWLGRNSFYVEHGDWFVLVCVLLAAFGGGAAAIGRPREAAAEAA